MTDHLKAVQDALDRVDPQLPIEAAIDLREAVQHLTHAVVALDKVSDARVGALENVLQRLWATRPRPRLRLPWRTGR